MIIFIYAKAHQNCCFGNIQIGWDLGRARQTCPMTHQIIHYTVWMGALLLPGRHIFYRIEMFGQVRIILYKFTVTLPFKQTSEPEPLE